MVEDEVSGERLIVMNDRSAGGTAYKNGTIEIMINRQVSNGSDELGNEERLHEFEIVYPETNDPLPTQQLRVPQVNPRFRLKFTRSRIDAFDTIRDHYLRLQLSPYTMYTNNLI